MRVNLGRFAAFVAQQILNIAQINPFFEQVRGERVAQGVYGNDRVQKGKRNLTPPPPTPISPLPPTSAENPLHSHYQSAHPESPRG